MKTKLEDFLNNLKQAKEKDKNKSEIYETTNTNYRESMNLMKKLRKKKMEVEREKLLLYQKMEEVEKEIDKIEKEIDNARAEAKNGLITSKRKEVINKK